MTQKFYLCRFADNNELREIPLSDEEWFAIFVSGHYEGRPLVWFQREREEVKRVTFAEHADGTKPS
jgi:hypothetical protein